MIWITGASSGIGKALTLALSEQGHSLLISSRREEALKEVRNECRFPEKIGILPLDLGNAEDLEGKVDLAIGIAGGKIDSMVHCGGISQRALAIDTTLEVDRKLMEVNYFGTIALTKALLPHFIENGSGQFVVVTSLMGVFSSPMRSGYCGSKHALHGFFNALRAEHADDGISVTIVCPGFVRTDISRNALVGDGSQQQSMDEKTGSGISAEECAKGIIRAMRKKKPEVYIGKKEILGIYLSRYAPGIFRRIIRKAKVT